MCLCKKIIKPAVCKYIIYCAMTWFCRAHLKTERSLSISQSILMHIILINFYDDFVKCQQRKLWNKSIETINFEKYSEAPNQTYCHSNCILIVYTNLDDHSLWFIDCTFFFARNFCLTVGQFSLYTISYHENVFSLTSNDLENLYLWKDCMHLITKIARLLGSSKILTNTLVVVPWLNIFRV